MVRLIPASGRWRRCSRGSLGPLTARTPSHAPAAWLPLQARSFPPEAAGGVMLCRRNLITETHQIGADYIRLPYPPPPPHLSQHLYQRHLPQVGALAAHVGPRDEQHALRGAHLLTHVMLFLPHSQWYSYHTHSDIRTTLTVLFVPHSQCYSYHTHSVIRTTLTVLFVPHLWVLFVPHSQCYSYHTHSVIRTARLIMILLRHLVTYNTIRTADTAMIRSRLYWSYVTYLTMLFVRQTLTKLTKVIIILNI